MNRWQLQEAKARLSEVVKSSQTEGPQEITVHGKPTAVLMSKPDFDRLRARKPSFVAFIQRSPWAGVDLDIRRDGSPTRETEL